MPSLDDVDGLTKRAFAEMTAARAPDGPIVDVFERCLSDGHVLEGESGTALLRSALDAVAAHAVTAAQTAFSLLGTFRAVRAVSPRIWATAAAQGHHVGTAVRSTAELLILRAGPLPSLDVEPDRLVADEDVACAGRLLAAAEARTNLAAVHRRVAKGEIVRVENLDPATFSVVGGQVVSRLIGIRDHRTRIVSEENGITGFVTSDLAEPSGDGPLILGGEFVQPDELVHFVDGLDRPRRITISVGPRGPADWERTVWWGFRDDLTASSRSLIAYEPLLQATDAASPTC